MNHGTPNRPGRTRPGLLARAPLLLVTTWLLAGKPAAAQEAKPAAAQDSAPAAAPARGPAFTLAGSINISHDLDERLFLNFGGPAVKLKVGDFFVGTGVFPSLRLTPGRANPILGMGPFVGWKFLQIVMPFYAIGKPDAKMVRAMRATFGVGYTF